MKNLFTWRNLVIAFFSMLVINTLLWHIAGRSNTIYLSEDQLNVHREFYQTNLDTLTILNKVRGEDLPWYYYIYRDYDDSKKEKLILKISEQGTVVNVKNITDHEQLEGIEFAFDIIWGIPLYSKVTTRVLLGSGSTVYEGYYVYFFGWHRILIHLRGIS